jgi:hypothetical protein
VLSDQHFPPALPSTGRQCVIIITVDVRMSCCMSSLDCWKSFLKWNENIYFQPLNNIHIRYTIYYKDSQCLCATGWYGKSYSCMNPDHNWPSLRKDWAVWVNPLCVGVSTVLILE